MTYIVFARKWRPKTFDEIIGQGHITQTLKNAIKNNRVAHAYIFAGPRGIGKTSAARIFAKALNCEKGPIENPCNNCTSCKEIAESRSLDVLEIDGASNRGIDEIRNLRENVKFSPTAGKFKIYIIDEVHMLTQPAFNALLKTLEEPPPHVKIIFATTQPDKVPLTILSRCQRFDFRRIPTKEIVGKLIFISKEESLKITEEALFAIARAADGSMRDAESILDQLSSFSEKKVAITDVTQVLGTLNEETLFEIVNTLIKKDAAGALTIVDKLMKEGKDPSLMALELLEHFRNLLIAKIGKDLKQLIDLAEDTINKLAEQSGNFTVEDLLYILNVLSGTQAVIKRSNLGRIPLEMAIVKLAKRESIRSLKEILDKISGLHKGVPQAEEETFIIKKAVKKEEVPKEIPKEAPREVKIIKGEVSLDSIRSIWPNLIKVIRTRKMSIASCLLEGEPASCEGNAITLGFPEGYTFHKEVIEQPQNKKFIQDALREILGRDFEIKFATIKEKTMSSQASLGESYPDEEGIMPEEPDVKGGGHKEGVIDSALNIFKGRIINKRNTGNKR